MKSANIRKLPRKCSRRLRDEYHAVAIDDLVTGGLDNIEALRRDQNFKFIKPNTTASIAIDAEWIFNLACCASPQHYRRDPEQTMRTCIQGAMHVLHQARRCGARIFHDPARHRPDITRARPALHWEPQVALDKGLRRTVQWFEQGIAAEPVLETGAACG